ncbi:PE domain-containing protein [Mycobacterium malmoense]|nr:PE domain-containing protein [Mycobacterium malmoense]QZA19110.1 PE domain-containing protein [Mycobacterium malmoense]UNB95871.1 PE domain-containing protein [Mycobacterium malmoense]
MLFVEIVPETLSAAAHNTQAVGSAAEPANAVAAS